MESGNTNDVPLHKRTPSRNYAFLFASAVQMPSQNLHNHLPTPLVLLLLRCICSAIASSLIRRRGRASHRCRHLKSHSDLQIRLIGRVEWYMSDYRLVLSSRRADTVKKFLEYLEHVLTCTSH